MGFIYIGHKEESGLYDIASQYPTVQWMVSAEGYLNWICVAQQMHTTFALDTRSTDFLLKVEVDVGKTYKQKRETLLKELTGMFNNDAVTEQKVLAVWEGLGLVVCWQQVQTLLPPTRGDPPCVLCMNRRIPGSTSLTSGESSTLRFWCPCASSPRVRNQSEAPTRVPRRPIGTGGRDCPDVRRAQPARARCSPAACTRSTGGDPRRLPRPLTELNE